MRPLLAALASCLLVTAWPGATLAPSPMQTRQSIDIRGHRQTLIVYGAPRGDPVIVSSGDGGWIHLAPRYHRTAPKESIDALFVHIMLWGREQGYRWFALGMAPLSGFEASPASPLWTRLGSFLYEHGEAVYRFQGLRAFKKKFGPVWQPHYLAYPGGFRLARVLTDIAALIAGGYRRIFLK